MTIKAIETRYAGCRFRSRLEARWAVFFDHLGIRWEYEPQGYVVDGRPYLPDFHLPELKTWVEVKGDQEKLDIELLANAVVRPADLGRLVILGPIPRQYEGRTSTHTMLFIALEVRREPEIIAVIDGFGRAIDPLCKSDQDAIRRLTSHYSKPTIAMTQVAFMFGNRPLIAPLGIMPSLPSADVFDLLEPPCMPVGSRAEVTNAYIAARSARFEHGEQP